MPLENIPARFANQKAIEAYQANLTNEEFMEFCSILKGRKWTPQEFTDRIQPLRPDLDLKEFTN